MSNSALEALHAANASSKDGAPTGLPPPPARPPPTTVWRKCCVGQADGKVCVPLNGSLRWNLVLTNSCQTRKRACVRNAGYRSNAGSTRSCARTDTARTPTSARCYHMKFRTDFFRYSVLQLSSQFRENQRRILQKTRVRPLQATTQGAPGGGH